VRSSARRFGHCGQAGSATDRAGTAALFRRYGSPEGWGNQEPKKETIMTNITKAQAPSDDVIFKSGEFTGTDGKKRNRYDAIGAAWRDEDGQIARVKLASIPVSWDGNLYFRARKAKSAEAA
jgi:hypothetical protein